ncbi:MAG: YeeE/YedE family protein, partial [Amylibacter sp.]|nr:YeeE/YedE family protein [Amylibacter sp.]
MFDQLGFDNLTPKLASVIFALVIGLIFGSISQRIKFCFRRSIVGSGQERKSAQGVWFAALASAIIGTQLLIFYNFISFSEHRFFNSNMPLLAIIFGGIMFGVGMVLTRGCISRLVVLTGTGNIRAFIVFIVFAITAHATLKGIFAPIRVWLGSFTLNLNEVTGFSKLIGGPILWSIIIFSLSVLIAY